MKTPRARSFRGAANGAETRVALLLTSCIRRCRQPSISWWMTLVAVRGDDHLGLGFEDVAAFEVAHEVQRPGGELPRRFGFIRACAPSTSSPRS